MAVFIDMTGQKFGRLTVIRRAENYYTQAQWFCECVCGNTLVVPGSRLRRGVTKSCGCLHREIASTNAIKRNYRHGGGRTRLFNTYNGMMSRCFVKSNKCYKHYGGRGIIVCEEWASNYLNFKSWAESSGYTDELTIERINNDGNYSPANCCWVPFSQQILNKRPHLSRFTGMRTDFKTLCKLFEVDKVTLFWRLRSGWSLEKALLTPKQKHISKTRM